MKYTQKSNQKNTHVFEVIFPISEIKTQKEAAFTKLSLALEVEGFRRGKAPATVAKKHIKDDSILEEVINSLLPKVYEEIVHTERLKPITSPKVELKEVTDDKDWMAEITIAVAPKITLPDYKKIVSEVKAKLKTADIWVPGKDKEPATRDKEKKRQEAIDAIIERLIKESKYDLPELLLEQELNKRLSRLLDDVSKIGLTVESYLTSKNLTLEALKDQYRAEITMAYGLEMVLDTLADRENIVVSEVELKETLDKLKEGSPEALQNIEQNAYMYAILLRRQKLLEFLLEL